jgi:hypothetical protein
MSLIYLLSSLPMLSFDATPAVAPETFMAACREQISPVQADTVEALLRGKPSSHPFATAWQNSEVLLRNAIARKRAQRLDQKDTERWTRPTQEYNLMLDTLVANALQEPNPLAREKALDKLRWLIVEYLQGYDTLSFDALLAYALKLSIASRWTRLDADRGRATFDEIAQIPINLSTPQNSEACDDTE